jgi:bleomycin hydrolase
MSLQVTVSGNSRTVAQNHGAKREREGNSIGELHQANLKGRKVIIDDGFVEERSKAFHDDRVLQLARNAIVNTGYLPISIDEGAVNKINHVFQKTLKGKDVKATNQEQSGRCWMFAGLNMFRHSVIADFNLKNFEFSQTYLYFWDKVENADRFLEEIIHMLDEPLDHFKLDDPTQYNKRLSDILEKPIEDGAYWNCFANLVDKYGLIPKSAMEETASSIDSDDMNEQLNSRLREAACYLRKNHESMTPEKILQFRKKVMEQIYNIVALFLGHPPKEFLWAFTDNDEKAVILRDLTPFSFKDMVMGDENLSANFVVLANYPIEEWPFNQPYEIQEDNNMVGGKTHKFINLPIEEIEKYTLKSINEGQPVWFIGDIGRGFHPWKSALDETLIRTDRVFGPSIYQMNKGERFLYQESSGVHAMTFIGVNDKKGKGIEFQVENSWGYEESDVPGQDGFLSASGKWFRDNVFEIVVRKEFLSRNLMKLLEKEPTQLKSIGSAAKKF